MAGEESSEQQQPEENSTSFQSNSQPPPLEAAVSSEAESPAKSAVHRGWELLVWLALDQWLLIVLGVLIAVASQHPVPEARQEKKTAVVDYLCVSVIFFVNGCTTSTKTLMLNLSYWKIHLFIQLLSFLMTSAVVFGVVSAAATNHHFMDPALSVGMVVLGCLPTSIAFNVAVTRQAHGNASLTVVESMIGNFIGPFISPLLIEMYLSPHAWYTQFLPPNSGGFGEIYKRVFKQLGLTIFIPLVVGQIVRNIIPEATDKTFKQYKLAKLSSFSLLILIWSTFDAAFASNAFDTVLKVDMVFVVLVSVAFFLLWFSLSFVASLRWLSPRDCATVVYCIPTKTPALGVPMVQVMFIGLSAADLSKIKLPMVIYQGIQALLSSLSTILLRKWIDKRQPTSDEEKESERG